MPLEDLIRTTISAFRANPPDGYSFSNLSDLSDPTQVYGVELTIDSTRYVSLLISHDPQVEDGVVEVVPIDGADGLASLAEDASARFQYRPLPSQHRLPWTVPESTAIDSMLLQANELSQMRQAIASGEVLVARQQIVQTVPSGSLIGLLLSSAQLPTVDDLLRKLGTERRPPAVPQEDPTSALVPVRAMARAIYTYPPVWFGVPPFPSVADRIRGRTLHDVLYRENDEVAARGEVSGVDILVTRRGLILCLTSDEVLGLATANAVLGILARSGIPQEAASGEDLIEVTNFREGDPPGDYKNQLTLRNRSRAPFATPRAGGLDSWFHVSAEAAEAILLAAASTAATPHLVGRALRLFDAQTLAQRNHHTEAFIVSWSLIEDWISRAFEQFWTARGRSRRRIREDALVWTAKQRLDLLVAAHAVDDERFALLDRLRKKRNAIVHRLETASAEDAEECFGAAGSLLELPRVDLVGAGFFHV